AKELGALLRCRGFANAAALLRTLLIHLADGCLLRETVVRAKYGGVASISDVALLKRLKASGEWLRWLAAQTMTTWVEKQPSAVFGNDLSIRVIDGSTIQEPGSTGSTWRIHYSICLPSLQCDEVHVTSTKLGESFKRFTVHPSDLFLADRGFAQRPGIGHVIDGGGNVLVRLTLSTLPLLVADGNPFSLLAHLRTLTGTEMGDWDAWVAHNNTLIPGRVCAIKKNKQDTDKTRHKLLIDGSRKGKSVRPDTLEAAEYVFVFTTLDRRFSPTAILEMYRGRWQIELTFKRLKSIIGLGHLKKTDLEAAKAWIHGKLLVAFLIEALIAAAERFFPWGYPICKAYPESAVPLERNFTDASSS
ncbi:MAG: IS4 family transposase, partial [Crenarchaeota archaeon]|nr:IS4 family transposase [Thermoproteota archaeon]